MSKWHLCSDEAQAPQCWIYPTPEKSKFTKQVNISFGNYGTTEQSQNGGCGPILCVGVSPEGAHASDEIMAIQLGESSGIHGAVHVPNVGCHRLVYLVKDHVSYKENQIMSRCRIPCLGRKCCEVDTESVNALERAVSI